MTYPKKIHIIGICGVATSALAIAFHKAGCRVTGSDKGFFPPVSTELEKAGVSFYAGWHPEKMSEDGNPDIVVIGTASGTQNPETAYTREHGIRSMSFAEAIGEFFVRKNSIVCTGTWGKTSSSALLSHILNTAQMNPSYMFGGISLSHESSAKLTGSDWSIFEGDEYKSSPTDNTPKFAYYKPTHLMLTAVSWDHADLYPTEESYFSTFKKLTDGIPDTGFIVANSDQSGVKQTLVGSTKKIIWYGNKEGHYTYENVKQDETGLAFTVKHEGQSFEVRSPMLGSFQAENITGCFAMAHSVGVPIDTIISAIASFQGLKRRMEKRLSGNVVVIDDIAHSPHKAASLLNNLRQIYRGLIVAVFEPNIGGRTPQSKPEYAGAFADADTVVIPRLSKLKVDKEDTEKTFDGLMLASVIEENHSDVHYIEDDNELVDFLVKARDKGDVIAFLGSHGFRGMIEETVKKLSGSEAK